MTSTKTITTALIAGLTFVGVSGVALATMPLFDTVGFGPLIHNDKTLDTSQRQLKQKIAWQNSRGGNAFNFRAPKLVVTGAAFDRVAQWFPPAIPRPE